MQPMALFSLDPHAAGLKIEAAAATATAASTLAATPVGKVGTVAEPHPRRWSASRASVLWPDGCHATAGTRRHSIHTVHDPEHRLPDQPALGGRAFLRAGNYVVDEGQRIGSTYLVHGWDSSVAPMARLTTQMVASDKYADFLANEGRVLMVLRAAPHRNLPTLIACQDPGASADTEAGFVFFNPMFGDLYGEARAPRPEPEMLTIFGQMVSAVAHCHDQGIVIGNIKLGKFMWSDREHRTVQLVDLSGAQLVGGAGQCSVSRACGSPAYVAPEVLGDGQHYDGFAADIWSLGVVCFVLLTGTYPFEDTSSSRLFQKIKAAEVDFPASVPGPLEAMLRALLCRDPADRLTAAQLSAHPVLAAARREKLHRVQQRAAAADGPAIVTALTMRRASMPTPMSPATPTTPTNNAMPLEPQTPTTPTPTGGRRHRRHSISLSPPPVFQAGTAHSSVAGLRRTSVIGSIDEDSEDSTGSLGSSPVLVMRRQRRRSSRSAGGSSRPQSYTQVEEEDVNAVRRCSSGSKRGSWCADLDDYESNGGRLARSASPTTLGYIQPKRAHSGSPGGGFNHGGGGGVSTSNGLSATHRPQQHGWVN